MSGILVLKLGGELIEAPADRARIAAAAARISRERPLVIVHGGGRAVDAAMARQGIEPRKVDGLRVTDEATLEVVTAVLRGVANTRLVAALIGEGVSAVGLSGVDAGIAPARRLSAHRTSTGADVDLGLVGDPEAPDTSLLELLLLNGHVPVIASLGIEAGAGPESWPVATVLNVNADVMACRIAAELGNAELVIAGTTPGVLDAGGRTIPELDLAGIDAAIDDATASAGMVAKLLSCRAALAGGVARARIVDGRAIDAQAGVDRAPGTVLIAHSELPAAARAGA